MIRVAILGLGTIGSGVYEIITFDAETIRRNTGLDIEVTHVLNRRDMTGTPVEKITTSSYADIENAEDVDVVVEAMGGTSPAYEYVKSAIMHRRHVVTSNKALVAAHGTELMELAIANGVHFLFEASVGGAIPIIRVLTSAMGGDRPMKISGILNGTTNYILTQMREHGVSFEDALADAQEKGYAERDPSADIEGWDTCRKIAILGSITSGHFVDYEKIPTQGITKVTIEDIMAAQEQDCAIKLIGSAEYDGDELKLFVEPRLVHRGEELYSVDGVFNAILVEGLNSGKLMYYGSGAGKIPTASAVVADICHTVDAIPVRPLWV